MDGCERHTCIERVLCSCVPREKKKKNRRCLLFFGRSIFVFFLSFLNARGRRSERCCLGRTEDLFRSIAKSAERDFIFFFLFYLSYDSLARARPPPTVFKVKFVSSFMERAATVRCCGKLWAAPSFSFVFFFRHFSRASPAVGCMQLFVRECTCSPSRSSLDSGFHSLVNRCSPLI